MIRILIVEDSAVMAGLLKIALDQQPDMQVIGHARDGREGVAMASALKPDLITMDIRMPEMDGFEATREIMQTNPVPIVVVSAGVNDVEMQTTFRAIEEGALWVIEKPVAIDAPGFEKIRRDLIDTVRAMAAVPVLRRRRLTPTASLTLHGAAENQPCEIIVVGTSTGGPQALAAFLQPLLADFPLPIAVVQHISPGFVGGLVLWLNTQTALQVKLAEADEPMLPGTVYLAPDDFHMEVERVASRLRARLRPGDGGNGFCPAIDPLFTSTAHCCEQRALGILMSGMGEDGAQGMLSLRRAGSRTLVQDPDDCAVASMPQSALKLEAVDEVTHLDQLGQRIMELVNKGYPA